ncbi:acyltransferase [Paenibacillus frigoriresistens]|uniref:acyltransferase family protein n=1 Tax=Paenibacillus alginolyticus TaxID=59839 RepID=UPI0015654735|nr:acyltransferase [Paenibacillus frigoriresistens]NRF96270.1 acyltransferase [Paenibacillus frigoriresistens]
MFKNNKTLHDSLIGRENNFDLIRFLAATFVLFSHSYPLSLGSGAFIYDPLYKLTNGQESFGSLGVGIFFVISGYFITQSFEYSSNIYSYLRNRFLRIYPALIAVIVLSILLLGPIFTSLSIKKYFISNETIGYFQSIMLNTIQYTLPGVFANNPYPSAINGSLWTLWYEVCFYVLVAVLGSLKVIKKPIVLLIFIFDLGLFFLLNKYYSSSILFKYVHLFTYFSMGMVIYAFSEKIKIVGVLAMLSLMILVALTYYGQYRIGFLVFGSYLIFYLAVGVKKVFEKFQDNGDFSYGMYIYAFPVQQIVSHILGSTITPKYNFSISFIITFNLAYISWHLIEKRFLKYKNTKIRVERIERT